MELQNSDESIIDLLIAELQASLIKLRFALSTRENAAIDFNSLDTRTRNILINYHIEDYATLSRCGAQTIVK